MFALHFGQVYALSLTLVSQSGHFINPIFNLNMNIYKHELPLQILQ